LEEARVTLPPVEATELPSIHFERYPPSSDFQQGGMLLLLSCLS